METPMPPMPSSGAGSSEDEVEEDASMSAPRIEPCIESREVRGHARSRRALPQHLGDGHLHRSNARVLTHSRTNMGMHR